MWSKHCFIHSLPVLGLAIITATTKTTNKCSFFQIRAERPKREPWRNFSRNTVIDINLRLIWDNMHRRESFEEDDSVAEQAERRAKVHTVFKWRFEEFLAIWTKLGHHLGFFIGPSSDHWLLLSITNSLTHSLLFSKLDWCDPCVWRCQLKT